MDWLDSAMTWLEDTATSVGNFISDTFSSVSNSIGDGANSFTGSFTGPSTGSNAPATPGVSSITPLSSSSSIDLTDKSKFDASGNPLPPPSQPDPKIGDFLKNNSAMVFLLGGLASFGGSALTASANKDIANQQNDIAKRQMALQEAEQQRRFANSTVPILSLNNTGNANIFNPTSPTYNPPKTGLISAARAA